MALHTNTKVVKTVSNNSKFPVLCLRNDDMLVIIDALREKQRRLHVAYQRSKNPATCKQVLERENQISDLLSDIYRQLSD